MTRTISDERVVKVPPSEAWKLYGTLQLSKLLMGALPSLFSKIDVVEGDGAVGTILQIFFARIEGGVKSYKEKFTVVDSERRVKETEVVEGGYLDLGFNLYRTRLEVIAEEGKEKEQCITRCTVEYELKEEAAADSALASMQLLTTIMEVGADYLEKSYYIETRVLESLGLARPS